MTATGIETLKGKRIDVLDDGFVELVDYMGSDAAIVQAARVSYGAGTKKVSQDRGLIRYLMRHRHTTPFEMCEIKLHVRTPMDCWRQWIRHRTANVNECSTRYSIAIDTAQTTAADQWRLQAKDNRQGSEGTLDAEQGAHLSRREKEIIAETRQVYQERLEAGVAREQARKDLTLSTYTEAYWKIDLHNLLHFLELRMAEAAQYEIRQYAEAIGRQIVSQWVPLAWEAFLDYRFGAMNLSQTEVELLALLNGGRPDAALAQMQETGWLKRDGLAWKANREAREFAAKLERLGVSRPWEV
ncbi:MAG: FAD-dependent thymidylate synthase [Deltaproteobacteria bacterium]|nr:FAD-dependent thymidylate synthase [Deltaproteobacteria bacterium]